MIWVGIGILLFSVTIPGAISQEGVQSYALLKGTVFTNVGRSFSGVEIEIVRIDLGEKDRKKTRQSARSDRIGEFAFRVPSGPSEWEVSFRAKGFVEDKREIEIFSDERVDLTVLLQPQS